MVLLKTVRAKLTTLVGLSALVAIAALPFLHWVMSRQLVDVVDDRVPEAVRGFDLELEDDSRDLEIASKSLAVSRRLEAALSKKDADAARTVIEPYSKTYDGMGIVVLDSDTKPVAQVGLPSVDVRDGIPHRDQLLGGAEEVRAVRAKGCANLPESRPALVIIRGVSNVGFVMTCMTFDEKYLENSREKLGVELAVSDDKGLPAYHTEKFPTAAHAKWTGTSEPSEADGRAWALVRFRPKLIADDRNGFTVIAALDVTQVRDVVRKNILITGGILFGAALIAVIMGTRLARVMSTALSRINAALKRLEQAEYVHVKGVKTGDEIEDLASGFNTMVDGLQERDKLRTTFGKYMTQSVMEHLLKGKVELGGETLKVTILFTDIRGFTTISESMNAHELVKLLNEYFTVMVSIVIQEGGVVDKYIGDAIMAVFGAPVPTEDDARNAVRAAVRMRKALVVLNERLEKEGRPTIATGIGIHTGEVVAGNIGSDARMEYTVIGDAVNLASRLEGSTKEVGVGILVSDDTKSELDASFIVKPIREITVKGRAAPVMTYEVVGVENA